MLVALSQWCAANPTGPQVAAGSATVQSSGKQLTITNAPGTILNWQSFSIAPGELTRFSQQSAASAVLNRVVAPNPSAILGTLSSNGRVFLVNPHGIVVGAGALIDTAGFVASTLNIADPDFLAGRLKFDGGGGGVLRNEGTLQAARDIFLVGPRIENAGIIRSAAGDVVLAAGKSVTITSPDANGVQFGIQAPSDSVINLGTIEAGNAVGLFAGTLKHSGYINATRASLDGAGQVVLSAQTDAIVEGDAKISVDNTVGKGGSVQVLGEHVGIFDRASVSARGAAGGGEILIGGDFRGANANVRNATVTWLGPDATLDASATANGNGGKVIAWADHTTRAHGHISVRGGPLGGDGGLVETSGKHHLDVTRTPDITAPYGNGGHWLLDPEDVAVNNNPTTNNTGTNPFRPNNDAGPSTLNFGTLQTAVNAGGTVTVDTSEVTTTGPGSEPGDITFSVAANFDPAAAGRLVLKAHRNIVLQAGITKGAAGGSLVIDFVPNQAGPAGGVARIDGGINSQGNLTLDGTFTINGGTVKNFDVAAGAVATFDLGGTGLTFDAGTINIGAATSITQATTGGPITANLGSVINVQGTGTLTLTNNRDFVVGGGAGATPQLVIQGGGSVVKNVAGVANINWQLDNQGTLRVQQGTWNIAPAVGVTSVSTGTLQADNGTTLDLLSSAGVHQLGDGATLTGGGTFAYTGTTGNLKLAGINAGTSIADGAALTLATGRNVGSTDPAAKLTNLGTLTLDTNTISGILINGATGDAGTLQVNGTGTTQVSGLTLTNGTATVAGGTALTSTGDFNWQGGDLVRGGGGMATINAANVTVTSNTALIGSGVFVNSTGTATVDNGGVLQISGGRLDAATTALNATTGTLTFTSGTLNPGTFNNDGIFNLGAPGTLSLINGGTGTGGDFNVTNAAATLDFNTGTHTLTNGQLNGPGDYRVSTPATLTLNNVTSSNITNFTHQGILNLTDSTVSGNVASQGSIDALGGSNQFSGGLSAQATSVLDIHKGATLSTPAGTTFDWQQGDMISTGGGGIFNVGGPFNVSAPGPHVVNGPTLNVTGTTTVANGQQLQVDAGALNANGALDNAGTVTVNTGTSTFRGGGTSTGIFDVANGALIQFVNSTHNWNGAQLNGGGTYNVAGTTGQINITASSTSNVNFFELNAGTFNVAAGQTFTKNGGTFQWTGGQISGAASGAVTLAGGATLSFAGTGTRTLNGPAFNVGAFTLNTGTFTLQSGAVTAANATTIGANGTLQYNGGTFTPQSTFDNAGNVSLAGGTTLNLGGNGTHSGTYTLANGTTLNFTGGTHTLNGAQLNGAGVYVGNGASFDVTGSSSANGTEFDLLAGTLGLRAGQTFTKSSGTFNWNGGTIGNTGTLAFTNNAAFTSGGAGTKTLNGANIGVDSLTLTNGTLVLQNGMLTASGATTIQGPATFRVDGGTFAPAGAFDNAGTFTLNSGTVNLAAGGTDSGTFNVATGATLGFTGGTHTLNAAQLNGAGSYTNNGATLDVTGSSAANGTLFLQAAGTLNVAAGQTFTKNTGTFGWDGGQLTGPGTVAATGATLLFSGAGARTLDGPTLNAAAFNLGSGSVAMQSGSINASGAVTVGASGTLQVLGGIFNATSTFDTSGSLRSSANVTSANPINVLAGTVSGTGTFNADLVNSGGRVTPGASPGTMTINGNYTQGAGGTLVIDLQGTQQGASYDWLRVLGTANLGGTLQINVGGAFLPQQGDIFRFMTYANRTGDFANFVYQPGFSFSPQAGATEYSVSLQAAATSSPGATNDVLALKENDTLTDQSIERTSDEEKKDKARGVVCR